MDLLEIGTNLLKEKMSGGSDSNQISSALQSLMKSDSGDFDIGGIVSKMMGNNALSSMASSWLGDGDNDAADSNQIKELFGESKISEFASKLGVDQGTALESLSSVLPQLVDKGSSGGSLLDSIGGIGGAADMLKKLF